MRSVQELFVLSLQPFCKSNTIPKQKSFIKKNKTFTIELRFWNFLGLGAFSHPCDDGMNVCSIHWLSKHRPAWCSGSEPIQCDQILTVPLISYVALGKLLSLSVSQFPHK